MLFASFFWNLASGQGGQSQEVSPAARMPHTQAIYWPKLSWDYLPFVFVLIRTVTHIITNRNDKAPLIACKFRAKLFLQAPLKFHQFSVLRCSKWTDTRQVTFVKLTFIREKDFTNASMYRGYIWMYTYLFILWTHDTYWTGKQN